jgi:gliding motility-associated-like protein
MSLVYKNCEKNSLLSDIKAFLSQKQSFFAILGIFLLSQNLFAEGTKQLAPISDDRVFIQPAPNGFASFNGPADLRMNIHIANPEQEQVFLGFGRPATSGVYPCSGSLINSYFRIKDPNGNVVFPTPGSTDGQILDVTTSNIANYAQAVAGPSTIVGGAGYVPFVFNPDGLPAGDYYIEFSNSINTAGSSTVNIDLFDITVATEGGSPTAIDGRVSSKIWSMYAPRIQCDCSDPTYGCFDRPFNGKFNVYVPTDSTVIEVDFANSGLQPAFFNIFFNSYGTSNSGNVNVDRLSLNSQQVFATEYPIFLNNPDENVYPSGAFGTYFEQPFLHSCDRQSGTNGAVGEFIGSVTKAGQLEVLIDLEDSGNFEFTANSRDVNLAVKIEPLPGDLPPYVGVIGWDGLDGLGNPVDLTQPLTYRMKYSQAIIHFPIYDSEYMLNGFNVQTIRPTPPPTALQVYLYYDDSNIPDVPGNGSSQVNLDGCLPACHTWSNFNYGNVNTINTYFFGSEERTFLFEPGICLAFAVDDEDSTTVNVPVVIDVVDNDLGTDLDLISVSTLGLMQPTSGTTIVNSITGEMTYTPNLGFTGVDMFEYEICDNNSLTCSIATVTVTVMMPATETDCTDGFDNDGDGLIDCDDPDCGGGPDCENPIIGIAKSNSSTINNGDGTYSISFLFTLENFGNVDLSDLTIFDDVVGQFSGMNPTNFTTQNGSLTANDLWNGTATSNILNANQMLAVGATGTIFVSFDITPGVTQSADNEATAEGTSPRGEMTIDTSTDSTDADGIDDDDNPDEIIPTTVNFSEMPVIGLAKNNASTTNNGDGTYAVSFDFVIENFGDVNLTNITLFDDIFGQFAGMNPTNFSATSGTLNGNTGWNGTVISNILSAGQNLNIGANGTVSISFTVTPSTATSVMNLATTGGTSPSGNSTTDTSTSGTNPDGTDGDDNPDEMMPTTVPFTENPSLTVTKAASSFTPIGNDIYTLTYEFTIENTGDIQLNTIEIIDDVLVQFSGMNPTNLMAIDGSLLANNTWTGNATSNVLQIGQNLGVGAMGTISVSFNVTLMGEVTLTNLVNVSTTTPSGTNILGNDTNVYDFTPPFCPALTFSLGDNVICGNAETNITLTADANSGQIGIYYTLDNQLDSTALYQAGHGGAILLTTVSGSTSGINTTIQSGALENNGTAAVIYYIYTILNDGNPNISPPCNVVVVDEITVHPSPNVTATVGGPFCEGQNVQLFMTGVKPGEMFQWTGPNGYSSTEQNPVIIAATTANDGDYFAVVTNTFGCTSTTNVLDVLVNDMPDAAIVFNNSPTCTEGINDVILTASTTAAGTINWYKDSGATPIGTGVILTLSNVTIADAGNYYAIIDNGLCTSSPSAITAVIVDEIPVGQIATTGASEIVCNSQSTANLSANNPAIGTGIWTQNTGNPNGAVIANPNNLNTVVTNLVAGSYNFTWSLSNGACQNYSTAGMMVTVENTLTSPMISGDADVCEGEELTLVASNAPTGATYEWQGPNGFTAATQTIAINPIQLNNAGDYSVKMITSDGCESAFSTPTNVTIFLKPATPIISGNEICDGENIELQTGSIGDLFEWFSSGNAMTPAATTTVNSVSIPSINAGYQAGNWTVIVTDGNGCQTDASTPYNLVIKSTPTAPIATYNDPVCAGQNLSLMATTISGATYMWSGPNGYSSLQQSPTIMNVGSVSNGIYEVVAIIDGCASETAAVTITINENPIVTAANNGASCGNDLELYANASGGMGQLNYLWNGPNTFTSAIENPVIPNPTSANEGTYTLIVMDDNGCSTETMTDVNLGVGATVQPEVSSNSPSCEGENLIISTAQYAGQSVTYEWTGPNGTSTTGGDYPNASTITILNATTVNSGDYTVFVNVDGCGSNTSSAHTVILNNTATANASTNFTGNCVDGQTNITLLANASNGDTPYTYVWNGPNGFTSNAANSTIANATAANSGTYTVMVTDGNGCQAEISTLDLNLADQPATPMITSPQMACDGENVQLSLTNADPSVTYSWRFNGNAIANNDSPTLVIDPATAANSGTYEVTVTKADCTPTSATAELTVSSELAATVNDQDFGCTDGATDVVIASNVTGGIAPYSYAWTGPNGYISTQAMPTITGASSDDAGTYNVIITDANACASGNVSAVISIKDALDQAVFKPLNNAPCEGENVVLEIQPYNGVNVNYNWDFNGNSITNNSNVLIINNATGTNNGTVEVSVTVDGCSTPAPASFDLVVNEAIAATVANQNLTCIDNNTDLTLSANITAGTAPFSYAWIGPNGFTSNAESPVITSANAANAGTYEVMITDDNACQSSTIIAIIQITEAPDAPTLTTTPNTCEGGAVVLSTQSYLGTNVTYAWTKDGVAIANNANVLNINPATPNDSGDYVVSVTVDGCTAAPSNMTSVEVFENPTIVIAVLPAQNCTDGTQSIILDATPAAGSGIYTYSWSGPNGFISTDQDPILNNINQMMAGTYTVEFFDNKGCQGASVSVSIEITDAPDQPLISSSNPNACEGEAVILSVNPASGANVSYAWTLDGNALSETTNTLTINNIMLANSGDYQVIVIVDGCTSQSAIFAQATFAEPQLTIFSVNDLACADGTTDILIQTEVSTGTAPYNFVWAGPNGFSSVEQNPIITGATSADAGNYQVTFTDANGCVSTTKSVTINVTDGIEQPTVLTSNGAVCEGESLTLSVTSYGGANVTYQWSKDGNPIQNNDMPTLSFAAVSAADNGNYNLTVTVNGCANFANTFTLNINEIPSVMASSSANGNTMECADGTQDIQLMATVTGGTALFIYAWTGPNGFASSLQNPTISDATEADAGTYQVMIADANNCGSQTAAVELNITDGIAQPQIMANNVSGNANTCEGEDLTLTVDAYTGAMVTYAWTLNGATTANNSNELIIQNAMIADAGAYEVTVTVDGCDATSTPFTVGIFGQPMISVGTLPDFTCTDGTQTYIVDATIGNGSGVYNYAWTGPNGFQATTEDLNFPNATSDINGAYTLTATDATGCVSELEAVQVFVQDGIDEPIISATGPVCEGGEVTLEVTEYQGANVTYAWILNGNALPIIGHQYPIQNAMATDAGDYQVTVTVNNCESLSDIFTLNVFGAPMVNIAPVIEILCADDTQDITLTTTVTGGIAPYIYTWQGPNGFTSTVASPTLSNVSSLQSGTYIVTVTDVNNCGTNATSIEVVIGNGIDQPVVISNTGNVCEGENTQLSIQNYSGANVTFAWYLNNSLIATNTNQHFINAATAADSGNYRVVVTVNDCEASSEEFALEIYTSPQVEIVAIAPIACSDGTPNITLQTTISQGTAPFTYEWSGPNGYISFEDNPVLSNISSVNSGVYNLTVSDANGCASATASASINITDAPDQPVIAYDGAVCQGEMVTLSVQQYAGANVTYTWFKDTIEIIGATTNQIVFNPSTVDDAGEYSVTVQSDDCSSISSPVQVDVFENPNIAVTTGPSAFCTSGQDSLVINSAVTGDTAPFTYEWVGPNGFFSVNANPVLQNVNNDMDGSYTVFVTDANGCQSNAFTIEIDIEEGIIEPVITSTGQSCDGDEFTLSVPSYSGQNVTYEWSTPNGITTNITGLNSNEIIINPITAAHEGIYTIMVTVDGCTNTSDDFNFFILDEPTANPLVATSGSICEGGDLELLGNASGNGTLTYEWSGPNGFTSNAPNPTINNVDDSYDGQYLLIVTNQQGCSTTAILTVNNVILPAPPTPTLTTNVPICMGEDLILSTSAAGDMFAWVGPLGDSPSTLQMPGLMTMVGTTTLPSTSEAYMGDDWSVMIKDANGCWSEISAPVAVEIYEIPQAIATNGGAICVGGEAQLFANVLPNATYEWRIAGETNIISTQSSPVIANVNEDTLFELLVTLNGCSSEAASTLVTVSTAPEIQPEAAYFLNSDCSPSDLQLNANVTTAGDFEFSWTGPNGFTSSLENPIIPNANEAANGIYELTISNGNGCAATYGTNLVSVIPNQVAEPIITANNVACVGETLTLTTTQYAGSNIGYVWLFESMVIPNSNNPQLVINEISLANEGAYSVLIEVDGCALISNMVNIQLLQQPTTAPTYVLGSGACEGGTLQLSVNSGNVSGNVTYEWNGPNGFVSNAPNPFIAVTSAANNGAYTVTVTNANGCSTTEDLTIVEIGTIPNTPIASSNSPVCEGGEIVLSVPQPAPGSPIYIWYNGLGEVIGNGQVLTITEGAANAVSPYSVKLVQNGCESNLSSPILVTTGALATPMLTVNDEVLCEGQPLLLNATAAASNSAIYTWFLDGTLLGSSSNPTFIINSPTITNTGIYTVQVNVTGCQSGVSNAVSISIFGGNTVPSTANATGPTSPACDGSAVILTTPFITGGTYTWFGPNGYTSTNFNPVLIDVSAAAAGPYYVIVEVPGCATAVSATTTVYVQQALPVAMIANDGPYCEGDSATLTILNPIDLNPTDTVTYEWFNAETMVSVGITDTFFIGMTDLSENQTGEYYVIMTLNGCAAEASEPTFVDVAALPQNGVADAGDDTELCASLEAILNATLPAGASGMWTSPTGATIVTPTEANSEIVDLQVGDNLFIWTLSQGGCSEYAADSLVYTVALVPADLAFAGEDENLCGRSTISLGATVPTQATGTWTQPAEQTDAGITIVEPNNPNSTIDGLTPGEYLFFWVLTEGGCENYSADTVVINIMDGPVNNAYIAKDEFYACGEEEFTLTAEVPSEGEGIWTSNTGALIVNPTNSTTLVADLMSGENWFYWTLSAPDCPNYSVDSALIVVHDDLVGVEDLYSIAFNESLETFNVLENDEFGNIENYSFEVITRPNHGTLIALADEGVFDYVPNANFFGFDTMQYVICNLDCPNACDTVTVSFLIGGTTAADDCFAPNLITPNGDGMNDALMFPCLAGGNFPDNNIMIFNRWGDKVYETRPYKNDWEGTYKGQPLPAGSYYYILMLEVGETPLTGFFTVVR